MNFDKSLSEKLPNGQIIEYGIVFGNEKIVFIKSGKGASCIGYEEKYLKMAHRLNSIGGYTVICSSNPLEFEKTYDIDKSVIEKYAYEEFDSTFQLYMIGSSNGAYKNVFLARDIPQTKKIMCINMPLMLNFQKVTREMERLSDVEKIFVYGTKDPSYPYIPMLKIKKQLGIQSLLANDADHEFRGKIEEFIKLCDNI